jgi:hypothetical protein
MPHAPAAAGKNIRNAAVNSPGAAIKFKAVPFTSNKPSAYNKFVHTSDEGILESLGLNKNLIQAGPL